MNDIKFHLTSAELESGLDLVRQSPQEGGSLEMIVVRPDVDQREVVDSAEITIMNIRAARLVGQTDARVPPAGDQLFVDMDLSEETLPIGQRVQIGSAVLEVSAIPHSGCKKFSDRFGVEAMKFGNSAVGKELHLRGINMRVIKPGKLNVGDTLQILQQANI